MAEYEFTDQEVEDNARRGTLIEIYDGEMKFTDFIQIRKQGKSFEARRVADKAIKAPLLPQKEKKLLLFWPPTTQGLNTLKTTSENGQIRKPTSPIQAEPAPIQTV